MRSPLRGHTDRISSLAFDLGSRRLVSSSDDGTVRVWSLDDEARIGEHLTLSRPGSAAGSAVFTPDGRGVLIDAGTDFPDTVELWPLAVEPLLAIACQQAGIHLKPKEWARLAGDVPYREVCR